MQMIWIRHNRLLPQTFQLKRGLKSASLTSVFAVHVKDQKFPYFLLHSTAFV